MKKLLLILGITNFIAIETSLIISCSSKLTKSIKWTTNSNQCGNSCDLEFSEILNSNFTSSTSNDWGGWLNISSIKNELPFDVSNSAEPLTSYKPIDGFKDIRIFYERNGKSESNKYTIDKIVNVKITFSKNKDLGFTQYLITSFSAGMPLLPEKENEQPIPRANHFKI